jgi:hypothetical protein
VRHLTNIPPHGLFHFIRLFLKSRTSYREHVGDRGELIAAAIKTELWAATKRNFGQQLISKNSALEAPPV